MTVELRSLDAARTEQFVTTMTATPAFGEYVAEVNVPGDAPIGDYYIRIYNDSDVTRKIGYLQIVSETEYHLIGGLDNLDTEITTQDIEDQLEDEFIQAQNPEFEVG